MNFLIKVAFDLCFAEAQQIQNVMRILVVNFLMLPGRKTLLLGLSVDSDIL